MSVIFGLYIINQSYVGIKIFGNYRLKNSWQHYHVNAISKSEIEHLLLKKPERPNIIRQDIEFTSTKYHSSFLSIIT